MPLVHRRLRKRRMLPQVTSGFGDADGNKRNKTTCTPIGDDEENVNSLSPVCSQPITCERWVPENILMDEISLQRDICSIKSMKNARNELVRRLAQQNVYFVREFIYRANPPQPFPKLKIKACYYLSSHGPIVQKSISLHTWCRLCVALDSLFDSNSDANNHYDECIKKIVTDYANASSIQTGSRLLTMSQLHELAISLLDENKIIRPSQFEVVSLLHASNKITQQVVSPQEAEEPTLVTETSLSNNLSQVHTLIRNQWQRVVNK
jgi:hypothetical protein